MAACTSTEMNQDLAKRLFEQGATLVLLEVPIGTEIGIDWQTWQAGPKFKGIKMIPPGLHFIYFSSVDKAQQVGPRTGFFHNFKEKEMLVRKWDTSLEDFLDDPVTEEEQMRVEANKYDLDQYLGVYPYDIYRKWISTTSYLTPELTERLVPLNHKITAVTNFISEGSTTQSRKESAMKREADTSAMKATNEVLGGSDNRLPYMLQREGTEIRFSAIPRQKHPEGVTAEEITKHNLDHSYVLKCILESTTYNGVPATTLLGELQFAFLCFILGQVYDGFEQWKLLVELFCKCDQALVQYPDLFSGFINVMHYQTREIPEDFFVDIISQDNFLVNTLRNFFSNVDTSSAQHDLKKKAEKFKTNLEKHFKWDFGIDDEDDTPLVVDV